MGFSLPGLTHVILVPPPPPPLLRAGQPGDLQVSFQSHEVWGFGLPARYLSANLSSPCLQCGFWEPGSGWGWSGSGSGVRQEGASGESACWLPFLFSKGPLQGHPQGHEGVSDFASRCCGVEAVGAEAVAGAWGAVAPRKLVWDVIRGREGQVSCR